MISPNSFLTCKLYNCILLRRHPNLDKIISKCTSSHCKNFLFPQASKMQINSFLTFASFPLKIVQRFSLNSFPTLYFPMAQKPEKTDFEEKQAKSKQQCCILGCFGLFLRNCSYFVHILKNGTKKTRWERGAGQRIRYVTMSSLKSPLTASRSSKPSTRPEW